MNFIKFAPSFISYFSNQKEHPADIFCFFFHTDSEGDSDDEEASKKTKKSKKIEGKKSESLALKTNPERKGHRRGGRRFHKKYVAAPRIIIPSRQNTVALMRQRTQAFIKERLFGASPKVKAPKRYKNMEEFERARFQIKARHL